MIDKAVNFNLHNIKGPVMHGHTKIELYNPKTCIKNVVESDNTFQGTTLANFLNSHGANLSSIFANSDYAKASSKPNRWKYLIGGIFLFRDSISSNTHFMPSTNRMVGNGVVDYANNTECPEMGTYNTAESSASASAITQVYDFATNQANGTIGCVCLTSQDGAKMGYGNTSLQAAKSPLWYLCEDQIFRGAADKGAFHYNGKYYKFSTTSTTLTVTKASDMLGTGSVFAFIESTSTFDFDTIGRGNMSFNNQSANCHQFIFYVGGGKFRFTSFSSVTVAAGGTFNYYEYDANNDTLTLKSFTNSASHAIYEQSGAYTGFFKNDIMITAQTAASGDDMFDLSTGMYIKTLSTKFNPMYYAMNITEDIIMRVQAESSSGASVNNYNRLIYPNGDEFSTNVNAYRGNDTSFVTMDDGMFKSNYYGQIYSNPLYLATINNLQSAVTKSPSQTMKVTYTLSQA